MPSADVAVYQAEWCPFSRAVRERLTELDVPFVAIPVPAHPSDRDELIAATGTDTIPAVVLGDGTVLAGDTDEILAELDGRFPEPPGAEDHRRAAVAHGM